MPFRTGNVALAAAGDLRVTMETLVEGAQGRRLRNYTVTRFLLTMSVEIDANDNGMFNVGLRFENENVAIGLIDPLNDTTADWLYWEEVKPSVVFMLQSDRVIRDIRSQRKSQGNDQDLLLYLVNNTG